MPQESGSNVSPNAALAAGASKGVSGLIDAIASAGVRDERIWEAFVQVPREAFVPRWLAARAFEDVALPIGCGQTISQPSMVAIMLKELEVEASSTVLEVGAGSGYAACLLSHLARSVHAVERHQELAQEARNTLSRLGRSNVTIYHGDGAASAPRTHFDRILISAAAAKVPEALLALLPPLGRLVAPIGDAESQMLVTCQRDAAGALSIRESVRCRFVPLVTPTLTVS
ncbi:MAG: protein-L-isoaspartate(D-aspartate) O-methyltransferase [Myxococcales bacterium]|nr:MAG: protein-L-isoaspartate(D-aspartate) O-methyltransferase [Myxococcales bacterium]